MFGKYLKTPLLLVCNFPLIFIVPCQNLKPGLFVSNPAYYRPATQPPSMKTVSSII